MNITFRKDNHLYHFIKISFYYKIYFLNKLFIINENNFVNDLI